MQLRLFLQRYYGPDCPHIARLRAEKKSIGQAHIRHCRSVLERRILTDPIADLELSALRRGDILDFRTRLLSHLSDSSVNQTLRVLKTCIKEGVFREELDRDPTAGIGNIRHQPLQRGVFSRQELRALFPPEELGPWRSLQSFTCFLLAATLGARRGEILALRWADLDLNRAVVSIRRAWKSESELGPPKWGRMREGLPLSQAAVQRLRQLQSSHELVFCTQTGSRFTFR